MFYSQVILAKKGPLAKVWLAAHWGDKKLGRPQIFATDISQSVESIVNPTVPLALRVSGHLLLGVVRIYSRKVKYVLNDCTEAMLKMQMAFLPRKDLLEQTDHKDSKTVTTVANFGEYDQIHIVEGFALPLPDENEWILAEDEENDEMMHKLNQQHSSQLQQQQRQNKSPQDGSSRSNYQPPEEEHWVPFDPDNEDDDDNEHDQSLVSEVEVVRAANDDSFLSADQTRRDSSLLLNSATKDQVPKSSADSDNEPVDFGDVPFGDDDDDDDMAGPPDTPVTAGGVGGGVDDSLLALSVRGSDAHNLSAISGLEETPDSKKRPSQVTPRRKRRKRRKVVIDNDETELSTDHIKHMIANTNDIVKRQVHPAEPEDGEMGKQNHSKSNRISLTQPFLADDGHLHPALQKLFADNFYHALDNKCPYERQEVSEDVEQVRKDVGSDLEDNDGDEEMSTTAARKAAAAATDNNNNDSSSDNEPADFGNDFGDMDEEEEDQPPPEDNMEVPDLDDNDEEDEDDVLNHQGQGPPDSALADWGLVNELALDSDADEDGDDEENREAIGDQNSNSTKWHKHTVRVLQLLQSKIKSPGDENQEVEEGEGTSKQSHVQFEDLSHNCTRRTAASVFFELLQLKTWDFVELEQPVPYGDFAVSAGVRFSEQPPNK
ncbi:unnamed protein product [Cylindrotheca closterium]|uniref:Double-strand-break repair protein rad21 homolog n=1 Tax=Cylindrotheca closterium TaxID=2856 RepID=A0AAD2FZE4_9STRA|nr:unnamed protein product [Cylindrotheca closterium]